MKEIRDKFDKAEIATLPPELFEGPIYVLLTESDARRAVDYLLRQPIVGIDTETRPSFRRGQMHQVALLQVATANQCFLFRLCRMGVPKCVVKLMESPSVLKVGLSLKDDFMQLGRQTSMKPVAYVELQEEVKKLGVEDMSLQKIYANLFGKKISKRQQLSNWEADVLTEAQQRYAATDAWTCLNIHHEVNRLLRTEEYVLIKDSDSYAV